MRKIILTSVLAAFGMAFAGTASAASGGPDSYGYTWKDSNDPNGPAYNWIEIATPAGGSGTYRTALNQDDAHEANIPLGFNFPYYNNSFNQISIGTNGAVYFENVYLGLSNVCIPGTPSYTMAQYNFIAPLWDDLAPNYGGGIYTQAFPTYYVIEYYNIVPCCATGDGDTWQVILFKNGNILMQYKELSNQGLQTDITVGIQNDPATGLQYYCEGTGNALANNRAILFSPPTFTCSTVFQDILAPGTAFCTGSQATLSAGAGSIAQVWSSAATTSTITVNTVGSYSIIALDTNGCTVKDTIAVTENALPTVDLGPDATACGSIMIDAANAGASYLWNNGATTQTITATVTGTYSVTVTDANSCSNTDAIDITVNALPVVSLGADITQCEGTVTLDAGNAGANYVWNDNSTAQTLTVSATGTYSVTVTDPSTTCPGTGSINVTINPNPVVSLGADITQCGGTVMLDAGNAGLNYLWDDNSTAQTLTVSATGTYSVTVTDPSTTCSGTDAINVTINPVPSVTLALAMDTVCSADPAFALSGGSPAGGTYTGPGVSSNMFDAAAAGTGSHTITYTYMDNNSCSNTATQVIVVDVCTGIQEAALNGISIYPNPAGEAFFIETNDSGISTVEVFNAMGQLLVKEQASGKARIDMSSRDNGIYLVKITNGNASYIQKIIIEH